MPSRSVLLTRPIMPDRLCDAAGRADRFERSTGEIEAQRGALYVFGIGRGL